ncbi:MAG: hypothetical protein JF887_06660 [Candidatus Dormibacteraeota bacterium]|uniref:Uncharacterized protein n=1 Tax=Candidatus Amunia macphersoniae TaxID=3127014 RepID=A0A934NET5_9BACT|nr:hypothetical protein [Candidatus Dormibacteraeota bacterium]
MEFPVPHKPEPADSVAEDLPAWCGIAGHRLEQVERLPETACYLVQRGR